MNTKKAGFLCIFLLMFALFSAPAAEAAVFKVKVIVDLANVRAKPDMTGAVLAQAARGTILEADERAGDWWRVRIVAGDGKAVSAFIHSRVVELIPETPGGAKPAPPAPPKEEPKQPAGVPPAAPLPAVASEGGPGKLSFALVGGAGITNVGIEDAAGYTSLTDWTTFHFQIKLQGFLRLGAVRVGLEFGYNDLYWWYLRAPYGPQIIYREASIGTWSLSGLVQLGRESGLFAQAGVGMHFFPDSAALGFSVVSGYAVRLSDALSLPLFLRLDLILGDGTPMPVSFGLGLRFSPR